MTPVDQISKARANWLTNAPVGHLATADIAGAPHVIPVCYVFDGQFLFSVLDDKPKSTRFMLLRRVRNIQANPQVSLVVDHYEEDWSHLGYILVIGKAELLLEGDEHDSAIRMLRQKYSQYRTMPLDTNPIIKITSHRLLYWGAVPNWAEL